MRAGAILMADDASIGSHPQQLRRERRTATDSVERPAKHVKTVGLRWIADIGILR
jgi:hypothetical protein